MGRKKEPNSWRSKGKGDCFTTKGGAVVCEGSKGMNYKPKGKKKSVAREDSLKLQELVKRLTQKEKNTKLSR